MGANTFYDASSLVTEKFNSSMGFAKTSFDVSMGLISGLSNVSLTPNFSTISLSIPPMTTSVNQDVSVPGELSINCPIGKIPEHPGLEPPKIEPIDIPSSNIKVPIIIYPSVPVLEKFELPKEQPNLIQVDLPLEPTLTYRADPVLTEIPIPVRPILVLPSVPTLAIPTFSGSYEISSFNVDSVFSDMAVATSYLKDQINGTIATLMDIINYPKMAISDDVRDAMIVRDKLKLADDYVARQATLLSFYAARGWNLPPGIMGTKLSELDRAHYLAQDNIVRDYTIKDWELSQQNWQTAMQSLPQYINTLTGMTDSILSKAIEIAKYAYEAAMSKFQASVEIFKQNIEVYKTAHMVYEIQINNQKMLVDIFKADMEGAKLQAETNQLAVELYKTYVGIEMTKLEVYKTKLDTAMAKMNYSKLDIDLYKSKIDMFLAGMSANNSMIQKFTAEVGMEEAKMKMYSIQLQEFDSTLKSAKVQSDMQVDVAKAQAEIQRMTIQLYEADIHRYMAEIAEVGTRNDSAAKIFTAKANLYESSSRKAIAVAEVLVKQGEINARTAEASVNVQIKQADINMHNANVAAQIQTEAMKGAASVAAQLAASSLSAVSAGAHLGATSSDSNSNSSTTSYNYNYSE